MKITKKLRITLYALVIVFIPMVAYFFLPSDIVQNIPNAFTIVTILSGVFLVLGIVLLVLSRKEQGKLKSFLLITGISAICPLTLSLLYNLFYALSQSIENFTDFFASISVICFITALIIAPVLFAVCSIGSLVLLEKKG